MERCCYLPASALHAFPESFKVKNCLWQMVPGLKEFKQLLPVTKYLCLGRLCGVGLGSLSQRFPEPLKVSSCT